MNLSRAAGLDSELLDYLEAPVVITNSDLTVARSSGTFAARFGAPRGVEFPLRPYLKNEDAVLHALSMAKTVSGSVPVRLDPENGKEGFICNVCAISGLEEPKYLIQSRQKSSNHFLELNGDLNRLTEALARERTLKKRYEATCRSIEGFVTMLIHDIRSPLSTVIMSFGLMKDLISSGQTAMLSEIAEEARASAIRLMDFIDNLYRNAKVQQVEPKVRIVSIPEVVGELQSDLSHSLDTVGGEIEFDQACRQEIRADRHLLRQLIQNLLQNAIKFREPSRGLRIKIGSRRRDDHTLELIVQDNGKGFDSKERDLLFELYHKGSSSGNEGLGIGLATCRTIVEKHGWRIQAEGWPGKGACFRILIPDDDRSDEDA